MMSGSAGAVRSFAAGIKSSPAGQMGKFRRGLARQKEINANNFPVKPQPSQLGTMTFQNLQPRESQVATGGKLGTMDWAGPKPVTPAVAAAPARKFPVAPAGQSYPSDFTGPVPPGGTREAGLLPPPALGNAAPARRFPVAPEAPKAGFTAFTDEQLGSAGWKMSTRDSKSGFVSQSGPYRGQTKEEAMGGLRAKFLAMTPEQRAKYDEQASILGGTAGRPVRKTDPEEGMNEDPSMSDEQDESYMFQ